VSNPVADELLQSIQPAPHLLGHYARPTRECTADAHRRSLPVLAALAAIETSARLGRYLPVSVGHEQAHDMAVAHDVGAAQPAAWSHWSQWDEAQVRHRPAQEGLLLLAAAQDDAPPNRSLAIELTHRQVDLATSRSGVAVRIVCRIGNGTLLVTALCDRNDPWAQACNAVAEMYAEILHALLNDRSAAPAAAGGLGAASRAWALGGLSGRAHDHGEFVAIPRLIESSVGRHPDRVAYCFGDRSLSYRGFDSLANALAALLSEHGVSRGSTVAVLLANGLAMPVAYQALMKLGAAFVPLDPAWPQQRLHDTLGLIAGKVVLCADAVAVPNDFREQAFAFDIDALAPLTDRPDIELLPEDPIYGFFTSGTTGRPKCAMNNHRGLRNRFRFMSRYFDGRRCDRVLQNTKHTFDSSVWQLFWPLTTGGTVVIPQQGAFLDLEATIDTIARHRITMTDFVPSVFNQVVALAERHAQIRARLGSLRELIVGGEEITSHMVHRLRAILPQLRVTNAYGPTETSIGMVFHPVEAADGSQIPLGRPIDNCHIVIVDEALRPLPQGACGELLIGGACVGNGYLGDAHKTSRVFIDNPFSSIPGPLLYRSGDLGYFDSLGRLRFAGRRDGQVKIGGVRIELGEIEAAAQRHAHVHEAKALVAGGDGAKSLAVFATGDAQLSIAPLQRHLRDLLPRHSVPRHVFVLQDMPLTDGSKVDRRQLQRLLDAHLARQAAAAEAAPSAAAGDALLQRILGVFRRGLERPGLQPDDHFFDAGGDSLQALNTTMELARVCGVRFSVQDLVDYPCASLARVHIDALQRGSPAFEADDQALMDSDAACCAGLSLPQASGSISLGRPQRIFVTGATGFVGAYLVHELLLHGDAEVFALCRSRGNAQQQLIDSLQARRLWDERFAGRLHAVKGDLAQPRLGVDDRIWRRLAGECDAVVHCAALVNFLYDYTAHRAVNVLATHEVLKLALEDHAKPLHFISTLGTLDKEAARHSVPLGEPFDPAQAVAPDSGYSRSKWVAERLLLCARAQGAPVTVFRLGEVMPCSSHGLPNHRALTHLLLSAFVQLGAKPDAAIRSDWSPVGDVARRVIAAVFDRQAWNRNYHVFHPESVCFAQALERAGSPLETLSCKAWLARLEQHIAGGATREFVLLRSFLPKQVHDEAALADAFASLLTNNPRLFQRTACLELAQAHHLHDGDLDTAIAAYARTLRGLAIPTH
jgi:amino acid adenylation domain-containing protein/thioester reductase-like protein